jgi:FtsP/CotA-like multicopper oxidase with cupredoxin domain
MHRQGFSRRDMMKLGLAGTGYMILGPDGKISFADDVTLPPSPSTTPFIDELPLPGEVVEVEPFFDFPVEYQQFIDETTSFFKITSERRRVKFHSQLPPTAIWGYRDLSAVPELTRGAGSGQPLPDILGPTFIEVFRSRQTPAGGSLVRHRNGLVAPAPDQPELFGKRRNTVHLHGGHHWARADGFPDNVDNRPAPGRPGGDVGFPEFVVMEAPETSAERGPNFCDYHYPLLDPGTLDLACGRTSERPDETERPSTQWYHDHLLDRTGPNAYRGLAGFIICTDDLDSLDENDANPYALRLPSPPLSPGEPSFDIPLAIQDKRFAPDGSLMFNSFDHDGFLGDKFVVNGAIQPFLEVKRRRYRFRFLNASNARIYRMYLTNNLGQTFPMTQIATEGGLLARPIPELRSFLLYMAERVEVVVDFGAAIFDGQQEIFFENRLAQDDGRKPDGTVSSGTKLLKFILKEKVDDPSRVGKPDKDGNLVLRPFDPICDQVKQQAVHRTFRFDRSHGAWTINGRLAGDLENPIARPMLRQPEIWHLVNESGGWWHPVHIHSEFCRVLRRNGVEPPLAERDGMAKKDTILLRGNESVDVFLKFRDYTGPFVFHCHNMEHEDMQMMARFDIMEPGGPDGATCSPR